MTELESIISATCITSVEMIDDPTKDFDLEGKHFRLFLAPAAESEVKVGDVVIMKGILPYGDDPVDVPIAVGSWSPVIFEAIAANEELTGVDAYVAPIKNYKR